MLKKSLLLAALLLFSVALIISGCAGMDQSSKAANGNQSDATDNGSPGNVSENETEPDEDSNQESDESEQSEVISLVEEFGTRLHNVSMLAPHDILSKEMQENYGDLVSPELLNRWLASPQDVPGRLTSSPWPDRIEIQTATKVSDTKYDVEGVIIEVTSVEKLQGGAAAKRPVHLTVEKTDSHWMITDVTLGNYEQEQQPRSITYQNTEYGFNFSLPQSWEGYTIITGTWEGYAFNDSGEKKLTETGTVISIRHPLWTSENPRQDIPIMIFTLDQWNAMQKQKFHIGAAPVGPGEIGRNNTYVFAIPARYNYAFPEGYEEVEQILQNNPLQPVNP